MKFIELFNHLKAYLERDPDGRRGVAEYEVMIPTRNSSIGPCAATALKSMSPGMDWNKGLFFLQPEDQLMKLYPITHEGITEMLREHMEIMTRMYPKKDWIPRERLRCYEWGMREGFIRGMEYALTGKVEPRANEKEDPSAL